MSAMASQITTLTTVYSTVYPRRGSKTSKLRATGLCEGNSPVTGEFPAQWASNAENVSIWWRHHDKSKTLALPRQWRIRASYVQIHILLYILHFDGPPLCWNIRRLVFLIMMTSSNRNIFRVTGHLCGDFTGQRWIPPTKASDAELWCFFWSASE